MYAFPAEIALNGARNLVAGTVGRICCGGVDVAILALAVICPGRIGQGPGHFITGSAVAVRNFDCRYET